MPGTRQNVGLPRPHAARSQREHGMSFRRVAAAYRPPRYVATLIEDALSQRVADAAGAPARGYQSCLGAHCRHTLLFINIRYVGRSAATGCGMSVLPAASRRRDELITAEG